MNESYTPYVVETSIGLDRMFLSVLSTAFTEEKLADGKERLVLRLPAILAPIKVAVMPIVKKEELAEKAMQINNRLKLDYNTIYDEKDTMGRRYRRQDAIGTPFCVGIDEQTLEDGSISVRHRDAMEQERMSVDDLEVLLGKALNMKHTLSALQTVKETIA